MAGAAFQPTSELWDLFSSLDANRDGTVSRAELILALRRGDTGANEFFGLSSTVRQEDGTRDAFERVFQELDQDSSKSVTWEEFLAFAMRNRSSSNTALQGLARKSSGEDMAQIDRTEKAEPRATAELLDAVGSSGDGRTQRRRLAHGDLRRWWAAAQAPRRGRAGAQPQEPAAPAGGGRGGQS